MDFWKNFTYRIKIECYYPRTKETKFHFVTDVDNTHKTFEYLTEEEAREQKKQILTLKLERAVDLMNSMFCNGYKASIEPWFYNTQEEQSNEK